MRKFLILSGVLLLTCGAAHGTAYTYVGGTNGAWGTAANWSPVGVPGEGDCASLNMGGNVLMSGAYTVSELIVDNGTGIGNNGWGGSYTLTITDNGGNTSGDYRYTSTADSTVNHSGMYYSYDVAGHYIHEASGALRWNWPGGTNKLILRGTNKAYKVNNGNNYSNDFDVVEIHGSYFDNGSQSWPYSTWRRVVVKSGGQILTRPDAAASAWLARGFIFEGGQANLPAVGSDVHFQYQGKSTDNGAGKLTVAGGVTYPMDVTIGSDYWGAATATTPYLWRITGGDMTVNRDLDVRNTGGQSDAPWGIWLDTTDNVNATSNHLTVNRDVYVGDISYVNERYGLKLNASTVRIGRDLDTAEDGAVDFGSATVRLGGDLTVSNPTAWSLSNWSAGTSTLICDGNGMTGIAQMLTLAGNPLHTLQVDTDCSVALGGDLLLTGDLVIDCGTFNDGDRTITFNGDPHLLKVDGSATITGGAFDNIALAVDAVVNLGSHIITDNLAMGDRSEMYLNSLYTLQADGKTYNGLTDTGPGGAGPWPNDLGMIYPGVIPEPGTLLLLGTGVLGVLGYIRRRRMR